MTVDGLVVRPIEEPEFTDWARAAELPFFDDELSAERIARFRDVVELPRTLAAIDGDRIVATSALLSMVLTVPGGSAPMAGLTAVGVAPTHRRRGILSQLMQCHLDDVAQGDEPLAGLYAAEAPIYGRFGFASAAPALHWTIERSATAFHPDVVVESGVELVGVEEALRDFPAIYDAVRHARPGMPSVSPGRWQAWLAADLPEDREGFSRRYLARLGDRGYVVFRAKTDWRHGLPGGAVTVLHHMAVDRVASATLWRFVFDLDLVRTVAIHERPTDDLLPLFLADPRRLEGWQSDALWLRIVDVARALQARTYLGEDSLVLELTDPQLGENTGRWRLDTGAHGAACATTWSAPDLSLPIAVLAGAYLGHLRISRAVRAGLAVEHTRGAALRADRLLFTEPAPWCSQEF